MISLNCDDSGTAEVRWALLADPHLSANPAQDYNGFLPDRNIRETVAAVLKAAPQAALIAGDLAWDQGLPQDYARLHSVLDPLSAQMPICLMLGNHDNRAPFLAEFSPIPLTSEAIPEKVVTVIEHGPIRWILLDSLFRTDIVGGFLGKAQRSWLCRILETSDERPTLIVVHHPPDDDDDKLIDSDRLLRIVGHFAKVKAIFCAHDHVYQVASQGGLTLVRLPAVGMPFEASKPIGWVEAAASASHCRLTFHTLGENRAGNTAAASFSWK